jgi:hypothetical protein
MVSWLLAQASLLSGRFGVAADVADFDAVRGLSSGPSIDTTLVCLAIAVSASVCTRSRSSIGTAQLPECEPQQQQDRDGTYANAKQCVDANVTRPRSRLRNDEGGGRRAFA